MLRSFRPLLGLGVVVWPFLAAAPAWPIGPIEYQHISIKTDCPNNSSGLGSFSYVYELTGAARFAVGDVRDSKLSSDFAVGAKINGTDLERRSGSATALSVGNWTVSVKLYQRPFPKRQPLRYRPTTPDPNSYVNALYDPINPLMPPVAIALVGETNKCEAGLPNFAIEIWRSDYQLLTLDVSPSATNDVKPKGDSLLAFIKGYYSNDYKKIFSVPSKFVNTGFRDGFKKLYYDEHVFEAIDPEGVIDVSKLGRFCVNREGSLLAYELLNQKLFTLTIENGSLIPYKPPINTDIPDSSGVTLHHEASTPEEKRLIELGVYEAEVFQKDQLAANALDGPYSLHRENVWRYIAKAKERIISRLECID
jgi:hypothetical protein